MGASIAQRLLLIVLLPSLLAVLGTLLIYHGNFGGSGQDGAGSREDLLESLRGRFNYASFDCAARILSTNSGAKSSSAILQSYKDSYLLNRCAYKDKHVILELCQDVRIDTLVIANYEFFSSMVHTFGVQVSKKFPPQPALGGWRHVGNFTAENSRREQAFTVAGMKGYARYVRIDLYTHYGNEYYCPISSVQVYGKTMMEDFEESEGGTGGGADMVGVGQREAEREGEQEGEGEKNATIQDPSTISSQTGQSVPMQIASSQSDQIATRVEPSTTSIDFTSGAQDLSINEAAFCSLIDPIQQQSFCSATNFSPKPTLTTTSTASTSTLSNAPQDNIFKAIYDRLQLLERNVTSSARNLQEEIRKVDRKMHGLQDEIGIGIIDGNDGGDSEDNSGGEGRKERESPQQRSRRRVFRAKIARHLERQVGMAFDKMQDAVDQQLARVKASERLIFWFGLLSGLQFCLLILCAWVLWRSPRSVRIADPSNHLSSSHRRTRSLIFFPFSSLTSSNGHHPPTTDQQVPHRPPVEEGECIKAHDATNASMPLLLDEPAPDMIDAVYSSFPFSAKIKRPFEGEKDQEQEGEPEREQGQGQEQEIEQKQEQQCILHSPQPQRPNCDFTTTTSRGQGRKLQGGHSQGQSLTISPSPDSRKILKNRFSVLSAEE